MARFPRSVYGQGSEPDARFSLANERTYLAWIRTSLALIAGGVALELLGLDLHSGFRLVASMILIGSGLMVPPLSWIGWMRRERALRLDQPLPASLAALPLTIAVAAAVVFVVAAILAR